MDLNHCAFRLLVLLALAAALAGVKAADEATATLRREHREEALELREQQAQERLPPEAPPIERAHQLERQLRELQAQDVLQERQLRQQLQSSQVRQLQPQDISAGQAQYQLQHLRRERDAQRLQMEVLRPLRK
jgi:hypothetical protein